MGMLDMVQGGRYVSSPGRVKVAVYQSPATLLLQSWLTAASGQSEQVSHGSCSFLKLSPELSPSSSDLGTEVSGVEEAYSEGRVRWLP